MVRLYNFNGEAAVPDNSAVLLSFEERVSQQGIPYREVTNSWKFSSYEEAEKYITEQGQGNYVFGNSDPFITPVPLEKMENYELVYESEQKQNDKPRVKIFEYIKSE